MAKTTAMAMAMGMVMVIATATATATAMSTATATACVCVFPASGYEWVTVMHEIPIYSAQSMTSLFHTLGLSSTTPLVPLAGAVSLEKVPTSP